MDERDWLILHILYEKGNITKTGQALFISQPALTARLRQIEDEMGAKLVYRSGKGIHFTPQGEYLAKRSKDMLRQIREIKDYITNMHMDVRGTLRIASSPYMTRYKLPQLLKLFKLEYPAVEFKLTTTWSKEVLNLVKNQDAHIGFIRGEYPWPAGRKLLFRESMCIVSTKPIVLSELSSQPRINYRTDETVQILLDNWWRENFTVPPLINMEVDLVDTCRELALNGLGYAILPSTILSDTDGMDGVYKMDLLNKNNEPILRNTWIIYQEELLKINAVNALLQFSDKVDYLKL